MEKDFGMPDIFTYLDYRQYLKDALDERKKENRYFSLRYISQKVGLKSMGFLSMMLRGERNISEKLIIKLAPVFKLNKKEQNYFRLLVCFNQAQIDSEKNYFYQEILSHQKKLVRTVTHNQYEYYNQWYYSAIRELVAIYEITDENYDILATILKPSIKPAEVKSALELLLQLEFITKTKAGLYKRIDAVITSDSPVVMPFAVWQFQVATMNLSKKAHDKFSQKKREHSSVTMGIDSDAYALIQKKLAKVRSEIMEIARSVQNPKEVYQMNMQVFPLSVEKGTES